jgi:uncharacterized protein (DUF58 family)
MPDAAIDWPTIQRIAGAFRLALPRAPIGGRLGERLGLGTGSSLEFQDYRQYSPGDDLRHVDWAAFARSEVLTVRLYREEVAPRIDLVLDLSRSMAVTEQKRRAYTELCALLAASASSSGADVQVLTSLSAVPHALHRPEEIERVLDCQAASSGLEGPPLPLRRRSLRVIVSDFLFPHDPDVLLGRLARDGASLALVQLTLREEAEPVVEGGRRLVDVEGRGQIDLVIDEQAVADYRARFSRLRLGLSHGARRLGARFVYVAAGMSLREIARLLASAGVLEAI